MEPALSDAQVDTTRDKAMQYAEANTYSLDNPYLTRVQKADVEAIFQFPFGAFTYVFAFIALGLGDSFWAAYLWASVACVVTMPVCLLFSRSRWFIWLGSLFGGSIASVIHVAIAAYALFEGRWGIAAFVGLEAFGLMALFIPAMWLWPVFVGGGMNPKYRIAKRMFGITFPFEHSDSKGD